MTDPIPPETVQPLKPAYDALGEAKRLLRSIRAGALATVGDDGAPFSSLVSVATLPDGRPLLLLSGLSTHTAQLSADARCSLLLAQGGKGDPLAHPRLTLTGTATRIEDGDERSGARRRFLARHPKADLYVDFPDFSFWRLDVTGAHLNGGFARAARFAGDEVLTGLGGREAMVAAEGDAVEHMNADHREALELYATVLARREPGAWRTSGIDPEGLDLLCGDRTARIAFENPVGNPGELRAALKRLADAARRAQAKV